MRYRWLFALLFVPLVALPVQAGILFGRKKDKPEPKVRVPELIAVLAADKDADKRANAAEELHLYDPSVFPDIVPALIAALSADSSSAVRIESAHSLSKLRPVTQNAGEALEQAVAKDPSMRVRLQARNALLQYHWAGYRGKKTDVPPLNTTREPPLAGDKEKGPPAISTTPVQTAPSRAVPLSPVVTPPARTAPPPPEVTPVEPRKDRGSPLEELPPVPPVKPTGKTPPKPQPDAGPDLP